MQYIHSPFIIKAIQNSLKQATYKPLDNNNKGFGLYVTNTCSHNTTKLKVPFWKKGKGTLQVLGMLALILPTKSLTQVNNTPYLAPASVIDTPATEDFDKVINVAVMPEHLFVNDNYRHGFGYEMMNRYSNHLGATLNIKTYDNTELAIEALNAGEVDMIVGNNLNNEDVLSDYLGCQPAHLAGFGMAGANFAVHKTNTALLEYTKNYLCDTAVSEETKAIARFYQTNALDEYSVRHFQRAIKERLPKYQATFKSQAKKYNQDWELLVAISYQESHLNPRAVSRTGVEGLMMLTKDTASELGVSDRTDPVQSIQGGAKYLSKLDNYFLQVNEAERLWFVLAAYNMGPNSVKNIQRQLHAQGKNPNSWTDFYTHLSKNAKRNGRYVQCMHYVTNIRTYLETIKNKGQVA